MPLSWCDVYTDGKSHVSKVMDNSYNTYRNVQSNSILDSPV